jgi:hypothetical protein
MTKQAPTMPKAFVRKVEALKARRRHVDSVRWNVIACQVWRDITDVTDPDAELMAAIEAFRRRQLGKIDAQLADLGVEPPAPKTEEQTPNYFMMILGDEAEKRPTLR